MAKPQHIVCIKSKVVAHAKGGFVDYTLNPADIMLGMRDPLENDEDFRQVLPVTIFTHKGRVWTYKRTSKGNEGRLHDKIATCVGGHWDAADLVWKENSVINLEASLQTAIDRELEEEVEVKSGIVDTYQLPKMICADDTEVDRVHIAMVTVVELDGEQIASREDELENVGFLTPEELLEGDYNLETWARMSCEILLSK